MNPAVQQYNNTNNQPTQLQVTVSPNSPNQVQMNKSVNRNNNFIESEQTLQQMSPAKQNLKNVMQSIPESHKLEKIIQSKQHSYQSQSILEYNQLDIPFIGFNQVPESLQLIFQENAQDTLKQISKLVKKKIIHKYELIYDSKAHNSCTFETNFLSFHQQNIQYDYIQSKRQSLFQKINLKIYKQQTAEQEEEEQSHQFLKQIIEQKSDATYQHISFKEKVFLNNIIHGERLDDCTLESIMSIFCTQYKYLFFVPPNYYKNEKLQQLVNQNFKQFNNMYSYIEVEANSEGGDDIMLKQKPVKCFTDDSEQLLANLGQTQKSCEMPNCSQKETENCERVNVCTIQENFDTDCLEINPQHFIVFSPFCQSGHWMAFLFIQKVYKVYIINTLSRNIKKVEDEFIDQFKNLLRGYFNEELVHKIQFIKMNTSEQSNHVDCGYCLLIVLLKVLEGANLESKIDFRKNEIFALRYYWIVYFIIWSQFEETMHQEETLSEDGQDNDGIIHLD